MNTPAPKRKREEYNQREYRSLQSCLLVVDGEQRVYSLSMDMFPSREEQALLLLIKYSRFVVYPLFMETKTFSTEKNAPTFSYFLLRLYGRKSTLPHDSWTYNEWEQQRFENWRHENNLPKIPYKDDDFSGLLRTNSAQNLLLTFEPIIIESMIQIRYK